MYGVKYMLKSLQAVLLTYQHLFTWMTVQCTIATWNIRYSL